MSPTIRRALLTTLLLSLVACSTTRSVRPVGEGKMSAGLSIGGPLFTNLGGAIPVPVTTLFGRYGLTEKTDLDFGLQVPVIASIGVDAGASHLLLDQEGLRPAVMAGGRLHVHANPLAIVGRDNPNGGDYSLGVRVFEELHANASWRLGQRSLVWVSFVVFAQVEELIFRPAIGVGVEWRPVSLFGLTVEARQMAFLTNQHFAAVSFIGPADLGAFAIQLGFNFYPGAD